MTLTETLQALAKEYDPVGDSISAAVFFSQIAQGSTSIVDHHAQIVSLLSLMGQNTQTRDGVIISQYINSLQDYGLRKRLFAKSSQGKTLGELMDVAKEDAAFTRLAKHMAMPDETDPADVVAVVGHRKPHGRSQNQTQNQERNQSDGGGSGFCAIHNTQRHSIENCRARFWASCPFCQKVVTKGKLEQHRSNGDCPGLICNRCKEPGHRAGHCPNNGNGNQAVKRPHPDQNDKVDQPTPKKTVAVATEIVNSVLDAPAEKTADKPSE